MENAAQPGTRNFRIDLLRGISILLVLLLHFHLSYALQDSPLTALIPPSLVLAVVRNGNYGVTMFFVISGYLITSTSLRRYGSLGDTNIPGFYAFRCARLMPCLGIALIAIVALGLSGQPAFQNLAKPGLPAVGFPLAVLSVLTFWHNVLMQYAGYFNYAMNIYWSLSVEEVFYLAFPLLCVVLKRERWIAAACLLPIVAGPVYRALHTDNEIYFLYGYWACFDAIAFGCCAALLSSRLRLQDGYGKFAQAAAACLVVATYLSGIHGNEIYGFSLIAFGTAVLLAGAQDQPPRGWIGRSKILAGVRWLGRHSYELYLFHIVILGLLRGYVPRGTLPYAYKLPALALFIAASCAVAWAVSKFYAEPMNGWLRSRLPGLRPRLQSA